MNELDRRAFLLRLSAFPFSLSWAGVTRRDPKVQPARTSVRTRQGVDGDPASTKSVAKKEEAESEAWEPRRGLVTLFVCGDVMTGRGIDQVLPNPGDPTLFEPYVTDAEEYVRLAERRSGPIPGPVDYAYPWGDALAELERVDPEVRIVNLETAVTTSPNPWPAKGVHYRMHPKNVAVLTTAGIDCAVLANNHTLDWGTAGLEETLDTLSAAGIPAAGAGRELSEAVAPAEFEHRAGGRVLVFAFGATSSGIPGGWAASTERVGIWMLEGLSQRFAEDLGEQVRALRQPGDIVVASIHWGPNWGYEIPARERDFAHRLITDGGVDVVHGHSSHHAKGIEVYRGRPIFYGCGDFLNDYEGISGHSEYHPELGLMYFPTLDSADGSLVRLDITPLRIRRFRLEPAPRSDVEWLEDMLDREGGPLGTHTEIGEGGRLRVRWD